MHGTGGCCFRLAIIQSFRFDTPKADRPLNKSDDDDAQKKRSLTFTSVAAGEQAIRSDREKHNCAAFILTHMRDP